MKISKAGSKIKAVTTKTLKTGADLRPKDKITPKDPVMARVQKQFAGIMTPKEADDFAASIGRKL